MIMIMVIIMGMIIITVMIVPMTMTIMMMMENMEIICPMFSFLATGATRVEVYRSHTGRVGGRVATAVFIFLTYILLLAWLLVLFCCIVITTGTTLSWGM